jgi:hypothetical protein
MKYTRFAAIVGVVGETDFTLILASSETGRLAEPCRQVASFLPH